MTEKDRKVDLFFSLVRTVYGVSKFNAMWPTELDLAGAKVMWADDIDRHNPDELRSALNNAKSMATSGNEDWQWPNIGLILGGAKRHANTSHKMLLPEPEKHISSKSEAMENIKNIKLMLTD